MVKSVDNVKEYIKNMMKFDKGLTIDTTFEEEMRLFLEVYSLATEFTNITLGKNVIFSKFQFEWGFLTSRPSKITKNKFLVELPTAMSKRKEKTFESIYYALANFFDVRFITIIKKTELTVIIPYIIILYQKQNSVNDLTNVSLKEYELVASDAKRGFSSFEDQERFKYLKGLTKEVEIKDKVKDNIEHMLIAECYKYFEKKFEVDDCVDPIIYWERLKFEFTYLHNIMSIVMGIPCSEISVERSFSVFRFIYNDYRTFIIHDFLEKLMFLKLNSDEINNLRK